MAKRAWVLMHCARSARDLVAVFQESEGEWILTETRLEPNSGDGRVLAGNRSLSGSFRIGAGYAGCSSCGADNFVRCNTCTALSCWASSSPRFECGSCGNSGIVSGNIESINPLDIG